MKEIFDAIVDLKYTKKYDPIIGSDWRYFCQTFICNLDKNKTKFDVIQTKQNFHCNIE